MRIFSIKMNEEEEELLVSAHLAAFNESQISRHKLMKDILEAGLREILDRSS